MAKGKKLPRSFYAREDVVALSRELLGKVLVTRIDDVLTSGLITETEAYQGVNDRASHAFGGKVTKRNEVMYGEPGHAYIYLCYGVHHLFNVVTNQPGTPHAILVRAIHPLEGRDTMLKRRGTKVLTTGGPGTLSQALGLHKRQTGEDLLGDLVTIEDRGIIVPENAVVAGPRIGVDYAGDDALLPYRFYFDPKILG